MIFSPTSAVTLGRGGSCLNRCAHTLPEDVVFSFIIMPDGIGHRKSAKPSDGLRTRFPLYDYDDMVDAQYRLVTEGLGLRHLRLVLGNSMGGMHPWIWGVRYPHFMDALVPMACSPARCPAATG
jgi:homoserine O-acetyltransferase/O-succinyltransferase